jgi:subtilisin family serine protease
VAVVDSGVDLSHPDLAPQLVPGRDMVDGDDRPDDEYGHGTHVAGIVAAAIGGGEVVGVAPGARVMPVRVLDRHGNGLLDDVVEGVRWAVANGARVINLSLGEDTQAILGPSFGDVLREAWDAGAVPVVAAGNQLVTGSGFSDEPAMVVTATTRGDTKPTYSSGVGAARWGIAAPGGESPELGAEDAVLSTYRGGGYAWMAGTSQAAPHVSAAVAVLLGLGLSPREAVDRLLATATDLGRPGPDPTFGHGRLDLARAVDGLVRPRATDPPPTTEPPPREPRAGGASTPPPGSTPDVGSGPPADPDADPGDTTPPPTGDTGAGGESDERRRDETATGPLGGPAGPVRAADVPAPLIAVAALLPLGVAAAGARAWAAGLRS